jgi:hypothetical protein
MIIDKNKNKHRNKNIFGCKFTSILHQINLSSQTIFKK